ncbi:MAG: hypothetical protein R3C05_22160 [Pirellulaceae bacterium]
MIVIGDNFVKLLKDNGHTCTVPMRRLSPVDADYVTQVAKSISKPIVRLVSK